MMGLLRFIIFFPLAVLFIAFALANRHAVELKLDPLNSDTPFLSFEMPLYFVIVLALIAGIFIGGVANWMSQGKLRAKARENKQRNRELERETEKLKDTLQHQTHSALIASETKP